MVFYSYIFHNPRPGVSSFPVALLEAKRPEAALLPSVWLDLVERFVDPQPVNHRVGTIGLGDGN